MITQKAKYALKALLHLAAHHTGRPILISHISLQENIPRKFLESILLELRKSGIVTSQKGKGGGYLLGTSPDNITMAQVLRTIDGPIAPLPCVSLNFYQSCADCPDEVACKLHHALAEIRDANLKVMEHKSLAQILNYPPLS